MNDQEIGVGPHPAPWPDGDWYDSELLAYGDKRNVVDKYRYWTNQAIKDDMQKQSFPLEIAVENYQHDFNIGTIVRNANAFNVRKVHIIGRRQWNKRGAMVTNRYLDVIYHASVEDFVVDVRRRNLIIVAVDNQTGSVDLASSELPRSCILVFGGEGPGLSQPLIDQSQTMVRIEQFGSTRSVNVGVASGIVIYAWLHQHGLGSR